MCTCGTHSTHSFVYHPNPPRARRAEARAAADPCLSSSRNNLGLSVARCMLSLYTYALGPLSQSPLSVGSYLKEKQNGPLLAARHPGTQPACVLILHTAGKKCCLTRIRVGCGTRPLYSALQNAYNMTNMTYPVRAFSAADGGGLGAMFSVGG